jgi:hypothetical protein
VQIDDSALLAGLHGLLERIDQVTDTGLEEGARHLESVDRETEAYAGMSGAMRASTTAYPIGPGKDGSAEASAGFAAASAALENFKGHGGKAVRQDSGVRLAEDQKGIILTNFTDYGDILETVDAGGQAHIGPTIFSESRTVTKIVADASKRGLR